MRRETFYIIVDDDTLEYQRLNGEGTTEMVEAVKFDSAFEAQQYVQDELDEDFQEHCSIYKANMHYYLEKVSGNDSLEALRKENETLRDLYMKTADNLHKNGHEELCNWFLAKIQAIPTFDITD